MSHQKLCFLLKNNTLRMPKAMSQCPFHVLALYSCLCHFLGPPNNPKTQLPALFQQQLNSLPFETVCVCEASAPTSCDLSFFPLLFVFFFLISLWSCFVVRTFSKVQRFRLLSLALCSLQLGFSLVETMQTLISIGPMLDRAPPTLSPDPPLLLFPKNFN